MKRTFLILGFLLLLTPIYSQDKITKLTYEIVDTSICPTEQAGQIYTWITQNIAYDTKQLTNRLKYYSPQHTLNRKKAVCYGYSELFNEMCKVLEIESYIINGNCKGFGYVKGDHFTKSDHTWNIIYSDSSWIIIDPTWGSGSLSYDYDFKEKIKRTFNKGAGIKKRIYFTQDPNQKYFNISPDIICTTHFPIDSKWQLKNYPVSYNAFISDSVSESHFLNFEREIETVRYLDTEEHFFIDATNSTRYNPDNKFDIAYQYFNQAKKINISRKTPLDSVLYKLLISSLDYYDSTMHYLSEYKEIRRNQYKTTSQDNKYNYKFANNSLKRIINPHCRFTPFQMLKNS